MNGKYPKCWTTANIIPYVLEKRINIRQIERQRETKIGKGEGKQPEQN